MGSTICLLSQRSPNSPVSLQGHCVPRGIPQGSSTIPTLVGPPVQFLPSQPAVLEPCLPAASPGHGGPSASLLSASRLVLPRVGCGKELGFAQ